MVFGRRKSSSNVVEAQQEVQPEEVAAKEARRRNRLSKPLTNKSTSNLALLAAPDSNVASRNVSTEAVAPPTSPPLSDTEKRQQIKAHVFDSEDEPEKKVSRRTSWLGVAALVNRFESSQAPSNSSQTSLLSPTKQRDSATSFFSSRRSSGSKRPGLSNPNSTDRVATLSDQPNNSSSASLDRTPEPAMPTSRRASFQPGVATRKFSGVECIQEQDESVRPDAKKQARIEEEDTEDSDALSFSEGDDEEWFPPPQEPRSETPQSLDYTHLGGLRLGSLQVVNGRASPATSVAASMASRQLLAQMTARGRDASSDYGDDDGPPYMLSARPRTPQTHSREVSWYSQRTSKLQHVEIFELPASVVRSTPAVDRAAEMAAEYIAELPSSPYKTERRSSGSSSRKDQLTNSPLIAELRASPSEHSLRKSQSLETVSHRSSSPAPSVQSSTGSVLRITTKRTEIEDELFDDETLGPSRASLELEHLSDHASLDSFHSWHSPPKPEFARTEAFESAVEFQSYPSPQKPPGRSPVRSPPPQWQTLREISPERPPQRLQLPGGMVQSDSGYSSNNSIRSSSWERKSTMDQSRSQSPHKIERKPVPQPGSELARPAGKLHKPILKTRKTAPPVPSFSELRPPPPKSDISTASDIPKIDAGKPKTRKKLQKRNIFGKKKKQELYVQTVASVDDLTIPAIPPEVHANLRIRSQQVPELEKTFKNHDHVRNQASMSTMNFPQVEMRFPSPEPESAAPQPKTRRASWLPGRREEKPQPKHSSMISERDAKAIINDFGSVNYYLGQNPYDLDHGNGPAIRKNSDRISPFNVSTKPARPRSMFDDKTATEMARLRSSSIRERDAWNARKSSFNDRGGIPGKNLRQASITSDAPPMPALPTPDALQRRLSGMESHAPPPPPPPHSPRPAYVEPSQLIEECELAPPPPSHSPRPVDVTEMADPWAAQAAAWRAHRNGADQTMRRQSFHDEQHYDYTQAEEPLYPAIPIRGQQSAYQAQRNYSYQQSSYDRYEYEAAHDQSGPQHQYIPYRPNNFHPQSSHQQPLRQSNQQMHFQTQPYDPTYDNTSRPLPAPNGPRRSPAPSIRSFRSAASSMAEDLHPELADDANRQHPAPEFGRYSGGLQYGYEREKGFGGSAGTRSVSGKADLAHKGVKLREGFGVDLGDVPVIGLMKKI